MATTSFLATPLNGSVYVTDFTFTDQTTSTSSIVARVWDFGDGTAIYNQTTPIHTYNYPGTYIVSLTSTDQLGNSGIAFQEIVVDYAIRDALQFIEIPERYANPGVPTSTTFKVGITSAQIDSPLVIKLFASNSKSTPYQLVPEKWNFLTPTWRFLDKDYNIVTSLSVDPTPLYVNGKVAGVSGEIEFYYVDDLYSSPPNICGSLLLSVTLETSGFNYPPDSNIFKYPSYANNKTVRTGLLWQVNNILPDYLRVSENYLTDIYPFKWDGIKIPFIATCQSSKASFLSGADSAESGIIFSYPQNNTLGSLSSISIRLINTNEYTVDEAPVYFKATDENGSASGGYIFTTVTPTTSINTTNIFVSAVAFIDTGAQEGKFTYPYGYVPNPFVWVSNPERNTINRVTLEPYFNTCPTINEYKNNRILVEGYVRTTEVPKVELNSTYNYSMSGFSGIYGMAIDPRRYDLIATDAELNRIYKYSSLGQLLSTIELSSITNLSQISGGPTPSNISIDENYNFYVTLFNSVSVLKFDKDFNYLYSLAPTGVNINAVFDGDNILKPPAVETDKDNNVWVTYANPLCSLLVKYDSTGQSLIQIPLSAYSVPVSLAITPDNNVWVANNRATNIELMSGIDIDINSFAGTTSAFAISAGNLQLFSANGSLLSTVSGYINPSYLSLDRNNTLWFTHGVRNIGYIDVDGNTGSWRVNKDVERSIIDFRPFDGIYFDEESLIITDDESYYLEADEELGGLGIDAYNRVWVIDSLTNLVYTFSAQPVIESSTVQVAKIYPDSTIGYFNNIEDTFTYTITGDYFKSAQANGDWTGNRWYQKYYKPSAVSAIPLSGVSTVFTVRPFANTSEIYRINENFNNAEYFKSLALPDTLSKNLNLFDNFFGAALGTSTPSAYEDLGQTVYERIANFVYNHSDVDTCNIDQLLSLAREVDVFAADYGLTLPSEIKKYLDIASISKNRLWGLKSPIALSALSIGPKLNTQTDYVTAGTYIYLQSKFDSKYTFYQVPQLSSTVIYPLSSLVGYGFVQPVLANYFFYSFVPRYSENFIENFIDWNNPNTTLSPYASSTAEWYGDGGALETAFNYLLTENLIVK
jgi:PKD repeat protein